MKLEQIRDTITGLQADRQDIERAPPSTDECNDRLAAEVERLADRGRMLLNTASLRRGQIEGTWHAATKGDVLALLAVADPERLATRLATIATEDYPDQGISATDRRRRLAEIDADLHRLEIDEERLIRSSVTPIIRRADASPEIVLTPDLDQLAA